MDSLWSLDVLSVDQHAVEWLPNNLSAPGLDNLHDLHVCSSRDIHIRG